MKKIIILLLFAGASSTLYAQQKPQIISRDTINLRGYIYDEQGKPVKYLAIKSSQLSIDLNWPLIAVTDTSGYFTLIGVKFNDTLRIENSSEYNPVPPIHNKGSRFITVYLARRVNDINSQQPVQIIATRKHARKTPSFEINANINAQPFTTINQPAVFRGGMTAFEDYIKSNIKYPEKAIDNNIEGTVQIAFKVDRDGSLSDFRVISGIGYGCDEALIEVLKHCRRWGPSIHNGRPIATTQTVSVQFKLTDK